MAPPLTEAQLLTCVRKAARVYGVLCYHTHDSRRSEAGFPDLVLVGRRVLFRELKARNGRLSGWQKDWMRQLREADADVAVWRPGDWPELICGELRALGR